MDIQDAYKLLSPTLGHQGASIIFALALLASGQNSTITGTLAGQVVMEGFLQVRLCVWVAGRWQNASPVHLGPNMWRVGYCVRVSVVHLSGALGAGAAVRVVMEGFLQVRQELVATCKLSLDRARAMCCT